MGARARMIEKMLRRDIDPTASVRSFKARLSAYLSSAYDLYRVELLGQDFVLAEPVDQDLSPGKSIKGAVALSKALDESVILCFSRLFASHRRALVEARQAFITLEGDYFLPQIALSFAKREAGELATKRPFNPTQQMVFLYCLYSEAEPILQADIQSRLGLSSGSVSSALSTLVEHRLISFDTGGKTGRKKNYYIHDKKRFYRDGVSLFGNPVKEQLEAPVSAIGKGWLESGLSALSERSDLLPPEKPVFAISPVEAKTAFRSTGESVEYCVVQVLKYDPAPFAQGGCVDPLTMVLSIGEEDERISLALEQAMRGYEWFSA